MPTLLQMVHTFSSVAFAHLVAYQACHHALNPLLTDDRILGCFERPVVVVVYTVEGWWYRRFGCFEELRFGRWHCEVVGSGCFGSCASPPYCTLEVTAALKVCNCCQVGCGAIDGADTVGTVAATLGWSASRLKARANRNRQDDDISSTLLFCFDILRQLNLLLFFPPFSACAFLSSAFLPQKSLPCAGRP